MFITSAGQHNIINYLKKKIITKTLQQFKLYLAREDRMYILQYKTIHNVLRGAWYFQSCSSNLAQYQKL